MRGDIADDDPFDDEHRADLEVELLDAGWVAVSPGVFRADVEGWGGDEWPVWADVRENPIMPVTPVVHDEHGVLVGWYEDKLVDEDPVKAELRSGVICATRAIQVDEPAPYVRFMNAYALGLPKIVLGDSVHDRTFLEHWSPFD